MNGGWMNEYLGNWPLWPFWRVYFFIKSYDQSFTSRYNYCSVRSSTGCLMVSPQWGVPFGDHARPLACTFGVHHRPVKSVCEGHVWCAHEVAGLHRCPRFSHVQAARAIALGYIERLLWLVVLKADVLSFFHTWQVWWGGGASGVSQHKRVGGGSVPPRGARAWSHLFSMLIFSFPDCFSQTSDSSLPLNPWALYVINDQILF